MQYNLKSIFIRYIPNVVQMKFSLHLTPMHMSLIFRQTNYFPDASIQRNMTL